MLPLVYNGFWKDFAWALWYGVAVFAMGMVGYFVLTVKFDVLPAWVTVGGTAVIALWVFVFSWHEERSSTLATNKRLRI